MPQAVILGGGAWRRALRDRVRALGMLPPLILVAIAFHILSGGRFLSGPNIGVLLHQVAVNTVLAAGMTFVILAGGIDLSVSSILAASALLGLATSNIASLTDGWIFVSLAAGSGFGLVNGVLVSRLGLPPFIVTLASSTVVLGLARAITGDMTVYNVNLPYSAIGNASLCGVPAPAILGAGVIAVSWFILKRTVLGTFIYAVGNNQTAARLSGIDVRRVALVVYGLSGLSSGLGAIMMVTVLHGANAMQVGQSYTLDAITAVILGGTSFVGGIGSIWGTVIGTLLIGVLSNGLILTGVSDMWQHLVKGMVIIGAVALDRARLVGSARA